MNTPLNTVQPPFTPRAKASQQQPAAAPTDDAAPEWADEVPGYSVGQVIGVGGFCKVRLGVEEASGQQVAFKIVEKSQALQVCSISVACPHSACKHGCLFACRRRFQHRTASCPLSPNPCCAELPVIECSLVVVLPLVCPFQISCLSVRPESSSCDSESPVHRLQSTLFHVPC